MKMKMMMDSMIDDHPRIYLDARDYNIQDKGGMTVTVHMGSKTDDHDRDLTSYFLQ